MSVTRGASSSSRRLRRGTKTEDYLNNLSEDVSPATLSEIESPFQIQEYIARLVAADPHNVGRIVELPRWKTSKGKEKEKAQEETKADSAEETAQSDSEAPAGADNEGSEPVSAEKTTGDEDEDYGSVERDIWLYEHLRRLAIDLSQPFVVALQEHCSRETCPEMKAGEWLYLCAAHAQATETECCAIDYITHTLEGSTALLNSSRYFPSRLSIPTTSLKHFTSISRRLYRIFAHAWYHHRDVFDICEAETSLYERFLALSHEYDLVSPELLVIPSSNKSSNSSSSESSDEDEEVNPRG